MVVLVAEVLAYRGFLIFGDVDGVVDKLIDTFVFGSGDRYYLLLSVGKNLEKMIMDLLNLQVEKSLDESTVKSML